METKKRKQRGKHILSLNRTMQYGNSGWSEQDEESDEV